MTALRKLSLVVLLLLSIGSCSQRVDCPTPVPGTGTGQIPDCILQKSNEIVISRVGKAFFHEHVVFEPALSSYTEADLYCVQDPSNCAEFLAKAYYRMAYSFSVPELPGTDLPVQFVVDAAGNLASGAEVNGLPDCAHDPEDCTFTVIDEESAISIARGVGLEPGLSEWRTHFHWYGGEFHTYVWTVENTLTADESSGQSSGRSILIDATSGEVLQVFDLQQIP